MQQEDVDMKIVSVSIDERTYRLSRDRAARLGTSVAALVRGYLDSFVRDDGGDSAEETEIARRRRLLAELFADFDARGVGLRSMADNLPRDALYDRDAAR